MKTQLSNTKIVKNLVKQLRDMLYDVEVGENDGFKPTYRAFEGERCIFRAIPHSSGKHYLIQYDSNLIKAVA